MNINVYKHKHIFEDVEVVYDYRPYQMMLRVDNFLTQS
jgi:hypothetical protein